MASRLVEKGVVVTISAGNSGEVGPFYGSSGSSGKNVLAIASTANEVTPAPSFRANFDRHCRRNTSIVGYIPAVYYFDESIVDWPIIPTSLDTDITNDACEPFPEGHYNFTGKIATNNTAALQADETRNRQILERIPAGRWGSPADMAGAVVFLASSASDYVNGHILAVDGGWLAR